MYKLYLQRFAESGDASQAAAETTGDATQAAAAEGTKASFEDLIKGDYKEDYEKAVTKVVRQRFAQAKANETKLTQMAPIIQALASKYGTSPDDIESIAKYVDEDDAMYEQAAYEAGMSVEQFKRYSQIEAENKRLLAERQMNENRKLAQAQYAQWEEEAQVIQADYPNFDLDTYLQDTRFQTLLRNGISLKNAYIAMDADNIIPEVMGYTAQQASRKTAATIAQRGNRPAEGGMSGQAASKATTNVSKLSNAEIADIAARVKRGEVIRF